MAACVGVGLVLLFAGAAKLRQPAWMATAQSFGVPRWIAGVLPWVEIAVGALLATVVGLPFTALAGGALVFGFTGLIGLRLYYRQPAPCGCFGETSPRPIGLDTLVRNLVLLAATVAAALTGHRHGGVGSVALGVAGAAAYIVAVRARVGAAGAH